MSKSEAMVDNTVVLAGALPAAVIALTADVLIGTLERRFAPGQRGLAEGRAV